MRLTIVALILALPVLLGGCTSPAGPASKDLLIPLFTSANTQLAGCQRLGAVVVETSCACSSMLTYDRLANRAQTKLRAEAMQKYPQSDTLALQTLDLYLNNAVASGVAYVCGAS